MNRLRRLSTVVNHGQPLKVLVCGNFPFAKKMMEKEISKRNLQSEIITEGCSVSEVREKIDNYDVVIPFMTPIRAEDIAHTTRLKLIFQYGTGLEGIDIKAATSKGIYVQNIPSGGVGNSEATAEQAMFLMLAGMKKLHLSNKAFQEGKIGSPMALQLKGKKVSVLGFGDVGKEVVQRMSSFSPGIINVFKRSDPSESDKSFAASLSKIFSSSIKFFSTDSQDWLRNMEGTQILIVTTTLNDATRGLVNKTMLEKLDSECVVVNVARGQICVNDDLLDALTTRKIGFFASDVGCNPNGKSSFELAEPFSPSDPLAKDENTFFTPHLGGVCDVSYSNMAKIALDAFINLKKHGKPLKWINSELN